jgi:hypothetical protein
VKRLILLLIVLAGGLAAAAFAVPSNAANVNGISISQQQLNSDLSAIANSPDYQCFLNAEEAVGTGGQTSLPAVDGAGGSVGSGTHATISSAFAASYLDTIVGHQLIFELAAKDHLTISTQDLSKARASLKAQITGVLSEVAGSKFACGTQAPTAQAVLGSMPSSFVDSNVRFNATVTAFEEYAAGVGSSTADLTRYYTNHAAEFDTACFTVAEYSSQSDAEAALASVAAGTPFAQVAAAVTGGGPQGCSILYGIASQLPAGSNLEGLALNTVSQPIVEGTTYLLVEITSRTPTAFAKARSEVESAVQNAGAGKARTIVNRVEKTSAVSIDQRYGTWVPAQAQILPPTSPLPADVLHASVNGAATGASPTSTAPSTGQTP